MVSVRASLSAWKKSIFVNKSITTILLIQYLDLDVHVLRGLEHLGVGEREKTNL